MSQIRFRHLLAVAFFMAGVPVASAQNVFEQILRPLRGINIARLYFDHSSIVDFVLFLVLFLGIARIIFQKKFEGKGAKALTVAVGVILALALVIAEERVNFSIVHVLGPVASTVFIVLVGIVLFFLLTGFGVGRISAASMTYILLYLSFSGLAPTYFSWITSTVPVLAGLLALGLLLAFILLAKAVVSHLHIASGDKLSPGRIRKLGKNLKQAAPSMELPQIREREETVENERKLEHTARKQSKILVNDTHRIVDELTKLRKLLTRPGSNTRETVTEVTETLNALRLDDRDLTTTLRSVTEKHDRLRRCDIASFRELKKQYQGTALDRAKILLRDEIEQELKRVRVEQKLSGFEKEVGSLVRYFESYLQLAINHLPAEPGIAVTLIDKALATVRRTAELAKEIRHLDKILEKAMRRELKTLKKEEKTVAQRKAA